ncbi:BON domain-containing protein [Oceanibacterium hippocampi]|uniref:Osmotically-inducible protein Y n=1 Tax=Oceanibacterium hippocampi TaxID=745714 RepID=A0A1Y5RLW3_9PROT|nr:BON domain-containing protein [Oceanibacterium hippocampi]SLN17895.1 Osmotically-inducible protein Y precursor [Oceanibacterium hippocampi]
MMLHRDMGRWLFLATGLLALGGCASAVIGGGAAVGVTAAQERSIGNAVDDIGIKLEINHLLLQKDQVLFTNVSVDVVEGRVLLTGDVALPEHRVEAARLAWQAEGVREVLNELQVDDRSTVMDIAKDVWITTQLRTEMIADLEIRDINYTVETVNGIIYLIGIARDDGELRRVTSRARNIRGVRKVISHVRLRDDPRRNS